VRSSHQPHRQRSSWPLCAGNFGSLHQRFCEIFSRPDPNQRRYRGDARGYGAKPSDPFRRSAKQSNPQSHRWQIAGSMGMLASASIGDGTGVDEPIHGSAHDITGKGVANPLASILSAALLLDISFGMKEESEAVISAVDKVLIEGWRTRDISDAQTTTERILGTEAMGNQVLKHI